MEDGYNVSVLSNDFKPLKQHPLENLITHFANFKMLYEKNFPIAELFKTNIQFDLCFIKSARKLFVFLGRFEFQRENPHKHNANEVDKPHCSHMFHRFVSSP